MIPKNIIVLSANYRLLHPNTSEEIITDVHDLFKYLADPTSEFAAFLKNKSTTLDADRLGVVGISGGNYPARIAAALSTVLPRPRVWIPLYGMAGDFLLDHWVKPQDPAAANILESDDQPKKPAPVATTTGMDDAKPSHDAPLKFIPELKTMRDDDNRIGIFIYLLRSGTIVDYITGVPGISTKLRELPYDERWGAVPQEKRKYLLPLGKDAPATFVVHGTLDTVVPQAEGIKTVTDLQACGVAVEYAWVEGAAHALIDPKNPPNMVAGWEVVAERVIAFVEGCLR
jgi:acetyl esterase/lipase